MSEEKRRGLSEQELAAQTATDLPEREAMLVLDPGALLQPLPPIVGLPVEIPDLPVEPSVPIEPVEPVDSIEPVAHIEPED